MRQIYCLLLTAVTFLGVTVTVTAVNFFVNAEGYDISILDIVFLQISTFVEDFLAVVYELRGSFIHGLQ